jgi:hypothetical protein
MGPQGPVGPQGPPGDSGLSAFEIWLEQGNLGSIEDFTNTLTLPTANNAGDLIFWTGTEYAILPIGLEGQFLSVSDGMPAWEFPLVQEPLALRQFHEGGFIFYFFQEGDVDYVPGEIHGLVAAPVDVISGIPWGGGSCNSTFLGITGGAIGMGEQNTNNIVMLCGAGNNNAVGICYDWDYAGYTDWFLPSTGELQRMHQILEDWGVGGFSPNKYYWSSNEASSNTAYAMDFATCSTCGFIEPNKPGVGIPSRVRAVRKF